MHVHTIERGEQKNGARTKVSARILAGAASIALLASLPLLSGCAQAEKTRYMRHLTTVIEPSAEPAEDVIIAFDLDRKQLPTGAVAAGGER